MTREELRDYVDEQRTLDNIPYHVYSALIDGIDTLEQEPILDKIKQAREDIENEVKFWSEPSKYNNIVLAVNKGMAKTQAYAKAQSYKHCLEIIDKLIAESER